MRVPKKLSVGYPTELPDIPVEFVGYGAYPQDIAGNEYSGADA
jgi:hypothetical protein